MDRATGIFKTTTWETPKTISVKRQFPLSKTRAGEHSAVLSTRITPSFMAAAKWTEREGRRLGDCLRHECGAGGRHHRSDRLGNLQVRRVPQFCDWFSHKHGPQCLQRGPMDFARRPSAAGREGHHDRQIRPESFSRNQPQSHVCPYQPGWFWRLYHGDFANAYVWLFLCLWRRSSQPIPVCVWQEQPELSRE